MEAAGPWPIPISILSTRSGKGQMTLWWFPDVWGLARSEVPGVQLGQEKGGALAMCFSFIGAHPAIPAVPLGSCKKSPFLEKQEVLSPGCKQTHLSSGSGACLGRGWEGGYPAPTFPPTSSFLTPPSG
jgi:hypothetical protein